MHSITTKKRSRSQITDSICKEICDYGRSLLIKNTNPLLIFSTINIQLSILTGPQFRKYLKKRIGGKLLLRVLLRKLTDTVTLSTHTSRELWKFGFVKLCRQVYSSAIF